MFSRLISATKKPSIITKVKMFSSATGAANSRLCSPQFLSENINKVKVLDCSWYLPTFNRDTLAEFNQQRIKGSFFFGIDTVKDHSTDLPHMIPSEAEFNKYMDDHGISNDDHIVLYDTFGFQGACRVMWNLETFGHKNVQILNGGFQEWKKLGLPIETTPFTPPSNKPSGNYSSKIDRSLVTSKSQILDYISQLNSSNGQNGPLIIDARPAPRFNGVEAEPRPGLAMGHMPHAYNVPFPHVFTAQDSGAIVCKSKDELAAVFKDLDLSRKIVTTCGSGITAACLYVALKIAGANDVSVYDGSWAEYGADPANPVITSTSI
ncbi:putative 3-mercaptopyruvate sulfurtransferase [Smittium culicis]|uniref:Sulfurtransferase n=1 Tax=Smittium culicis TaxID=133412 RepID=A0A1R1YF78_9FUNG|nr:putative 3-mercaptopyruvate sulfurtransferase [Smittium culicis]